MIYCYAFVLSNPFLNFEIKQTIKIKDVNVKVDIHGITNIKISCIKSQYFYKSRIMYCNVKGLTVFTVINSTWQLKYNKSKYPTNIDKSIKASILQLDKFAN